MALSNAERVKRDTQKKKAAGMIQAKVWVHPTEAPILRETAKRMPLTRLAWSSLK